MLERDDMIPIVHSEENGCEVQLVTREKELYDLRAEFVNV